jgi:hypothetical protein
VKNNLNLFKGKLYRISFSAETTADRSITFYGGKASSPWNACSSYNGAGISTQGSTYTFTFTMTSQTDPTARLVFDLGTSTGQVNISSVKVEELSFAITSLGQAPPEERTLVYPNPPSSWLRITEGHKYHTGDLNDLNGRSLQPSISQKTQRSI